MKDRPGHDFRYSLNSNKIKRKLKSAVQKILLKNRLIDRDYTYVIFGKNNVYKEKFSLVLNEMNMVFKKIKQILPQFYIFLES